MELVKEKKLYMGSVCLPARHEHMWFDYSQQDKWMLLLLCNRGSGDTETASRVPRATQGTHVQARITTQVWKVLNSVFFQLPLPPEKPRAIVPRTTAKLGFQPQILLTDPCVSHLRDCSALFVKEASRQWFRRWNGQYLGVGEKHNLTKDKHGCIWKQTLWFTTSWLCVDIPPGARRGLLHAVLRLSVSAGYSSVVGVSLSCWSKR